MIRVVIVQDNESGVLQVAAVDSTTGQAPPIGHTLSVVHAAVDSLIEQKVRAAIAGEKRVGLADASMLGTIRQPPRGRG